MFSLFKRQYNSSILQTFLLDKNELQALRALAELIDCSPTPKQTLESRQAGNLPTRALGNGIDYAESRIYQAGDDPRSINWRLSARSQETFVKTYHIESRPSLSIFLDKRRSMSFGTRSRLKVTQATRIATLLAYACELHQLNFQAWILDDVQDLQYFDNVDTFLLKANAPVATSSKNNKTSISPALQEINQRTAKGSLIYLISDFSDLNLSHQSELAHLYERCFIQSIHIFDIAELNLPSSGKVRLQELHQVKSFQINTHKAKEQQAFSDIATEHFETIESIINDLGISYCKLATDNENIQQSISLPLDQP